MFKLVPTWITRDQRAIPIAEMETAHIRATIDMLRRKGFIGKSERSPFPDPPTGLQGEYAQMYAEQSYSEEVEEWAKEKVHPALDYLAAELRKRTKAAITELDSYNNTEKP